MGLDRVSAVFARLGVALTCPVITVGGTNGKGSTCALLECMLRAGGYRVGAYTSPHLLRYNERVRIDGAEATDEALLEAFAAVESVRLTTPLTYFEFGTLAALCLLARAELDVVVLVVGLGGRLDAVNVIDADIAIVTTVAIDHVAPVLSRSVPIADRRLHCSCRRAQSMPSCCRSASTTISPLTKGSGAIAGQEARGTGCRCRRFAEPINLPTRRQRSPRSTFYAIGLRFPWARYEKASSASSFPGDCRFCRDGR